jgi:hypothetical protein
MTGSSDMERSYETAGTSGYGGGGYLQVIPYILYTAPIASAECCVYFLGVWHVSGFGTFQMTFRISLIAHVADFFESFRSCEEWRGSF